jgi:predicted pyridoxine 5'-phosphate oxidase superfamily flavin-nucleotide-binding protein
MLRRPKEGRKREDAERHACRPGADLISGVVCGAVEANAVDPTLDAIDAGASGERTLQCRYGTEARADAFYRNQVLDHLNVAMRDFIDRQTMVFIATANGRGEADSSFRAGPAGFVRVLGERTLCYPEYRGNGVMASLGNILANPHIGLLFVDFTVTKIGLHVNGSAGILANDELARHPAVTTAVAGDIAETGGRRPERWVVMAVMEAYIHCSKHIPRMRPATADEILWGTDDATAKGGDHFQARASKRGPTPG